MHRFLLTLLCAFALVAAPALAQPAKAPAAKAEATKTAAGTIAAISGSSITVKTASGDMTFNIDQKTRVIAPGGSTKAREAQAEGKPGPVVTDVLKTGQAVDVKYHETGMHAETIRATGSAAPAAKAAPTATSGEGAPKPTPPPPPRPKAERATGTVSAVSGNSLTVKSASGETTVTVDSKTTVVGTGIGTAGRKLMSEGAKPTLGEFVKEGDTVSVTYKESAGGKVASVIRVTRK
jgi:hypothetical protein